MAEVVKMAPICEKLPKEDWQILGCFILLDGLGILNYRMLSPLRVVFLFFGVFLGKKHPAQHPDQHPDSILYFLLRPSRWHPDSILPWRACHGRPWPGMDGHGRPWPAMAGHGLPWPFMAGHGLPWSAIAGHGLPWPAKNPKRCARVDFPPTGLYEQSFGLIPSDSYSFSSFRF